MQLQVQQKNLFSLTLIIFIEALSFIMILPALFLIVSRHYSFLPQDFSYSSRLFVYAALVFIPLLIKVFIGIFLGALSDHYGRRLILIISLLLNIVGCIVIIISILNVSLWGLFLGRILSGGTDTAQSIAKAAVADFSQGQERQKYYSYLLAAGALALLIGPHIGILFTSIEVVSWFDISTPFWISMVLLLFNILLLLEFYRDAQDFKKSSSSLSDIFSYIKTIIATQSFLTLLAFIFLMYAAWMLYVINLPIMLDSVLHYGNKIFGIFVSFLAFSSMLGYLAHAFFKRSNLSSLKVVLFSDLLIVAGYFVALIPNIIAQWIACAMVGFFSCFINVVVVSYIANIFPNNRVGYIFGYTSGVALLASILVTPLPSLMSHISCYIVGIVAIILNLIGLVLFIKNRYLTESIQKNAA